MSCPSILSFVLILFLSFHARKGYSFSTRDEESVNAPAITHYPRMKVIKDSKARISLIRHDVWMSNNKPKESKRKLTGVAEMVFQDKVVTKTKTRGRYSRYRVNKDSKGREITTVMDYAQPHEEPSVHN